MEFEFDKVNLNIRMQMQEEKSTSKIQTGEKSSILKKLKDDEKDSGNSTLNKRKKKQKISVYATKSLNDTVGVQAEKIEVLNEENSKGINLDAKK